MKSARDVAKDLLTRLLDGERGKVPLYLAMLLERSTPLSNSDDHYKKILPPELAGLKLTADEVNEIIEDLCTEISRNPDAALIAAVSTTGAIQVTKCILGVLLSPPRPMSADEYAQALGVACAFLPAQLLRDRHFLSRDDRAVLMQRLENLLNIEGTLNKRDASSLLKQLTLIDT